MVHLELSNEEQAILAEILEIEINDLRTEIMDTDHRDFKEMLKQREQTLRKLLSMIQQGQAERQ